MQDILKINYFKMKFQILNMYVFYDLRVVYLKNGQFQKVNVVTSNK